MLRHILPLAPALGVLVSGAAASDELTSPSFRHLGGAVASGAATQLSSGGPRFGSSGATAGAAGPVGFSGAAANLVTVAAGFWPIVAGGFPSLDVDGDDIPNYLDDDDDGDGLADAVETGTGTFVSPDDTGTSAVLADTDGDGFADGDEVAAGSDPNQASSVPLAIPALPASLLWLTGLLLAAVPLLARRERRM